MPCGRRLWGSIGVNELWCVLALSLLTANIAVAKTASTEIVPQKPDDRTLGIIKMVLVDEIAKARSRFPMALAAILASWAKVSETEQPYLFVKLFDAYHCGNVDCELYGFEYLSQNRLAEDLFRIGIQVERPYLIPKTGITIFSKAMHGGAFDRETTIYRWVGSRYWRVSNWPAPLRPVLLTPTGRSRLSNRQASPRTRCTQTRFG